MERGGPRPSRGQVQFVFFAGSFVPTGPHVEIAVAKETLARAHKALQDLKVKRQRILSSSTMPIVPPDGSLFTGLIS